MRRYPRIAQFSAQVRRGEGKNLATKEDIEDITASIERVRSQHAAGLERVRAELHRALNVHKLQCETELKTYEQIWVDLVDVQQAALSLRPVVDTLPHDGSEKQRIIQKRLETFGESFNRFVSRVHSRRPFYPTDVFKELMELVRLAHGEAINVQWGDKHGAGYWKEAMANAEAISAQVDKVCGVVRVRLASAGAA